MTNLIINILAAIGALTLALIALALWAYYSDEEDYEEQIPIPKMQSEEK